MLDMLKERKAALEARGKKGFTLMEMLIVIAIIAVLVAIAIPVLGAQLEKARDSTSVANLRSAYAEAMTKYLNNEFDNPTATTKTITVSNVQLESSAADSAHPWSDQGKDLPFTAPTETTTPGKYNVTFTYGTDGSITDVTTTPVTSGSGD